ncbi:hypothetical protein KJ590_04520 [Patescibacteria group bacterium]|nr:hypothetical protein [Patescibacteria group bacterium]
MSTHFQMKEVRCLNSWPKQDFIEKMKTYLFFRIKRDFTAKGCDRAKGDKVLGVKDSIANCSNLLKLKLLQGKVLNISKLPPTLSVALKSGKTSDNVLRLA